MINLYDVILIALALGAMLGALLLVRPSFNSRDMHKIRKLRDKAEKDQKLISSVLETIQQGAKDTEYLSNQLKARVEQINRKNQNSRTRAEEAERAIEKAIKAEGELRNVSDQLGERIENVQAYWDERLAETNNTVQKLEGRLQQGLTQVDEGMLRLREQETMAQGYTRKLLEHQKEHLTSQQENAKLSNEMQKQLEAILQESAASLQTIQQQNKRSNALFKKYSEDLSVLEQQAHEQFTTTFQTADMARNELNEGMKETRAHNEKIREYETQSLKMHSRIKEQFEQVDNLQVDRLTKTVGLTDEMCANLQEGLENARALLTTLETKTTEVIKATEEEEPPASITTQDSDESEKPRNLFSLRAYR